MLPNKLNRELKIGDVLYCVGEGCYYDVVEVNMHKTYCYTLHNRDTHGRTTITKMGYEYVDDAELDYHEENGDIDEYLNEVEELQEWYILTHD